MVPLGRRRLRDHVQPAGRAQRNIEANPRVALNFAGDGRGGDIVVLSGPREIEDGPHEERLAAYVEKYGADIERIGFTPESFRGATRCRSGSS